MHQHCVDDAIKLILLEAATSGKSTAQQNTSEEQSYDICLNFRLQQSQNDQGTRFLTTPFTSTPQGEFRPRLYFSQMLI